MSGGGSTTQTTAKPTNTAPAAANVAMQQYPAFQPGQLGLLADQMTQGFGGTQAENMGILSNLYKPVSMPIISKPSDIAAYLKQAGVTSPTATNSTGTDQSKMKTKDWMYQQWVNDGKKSI